MTSDTYLMPEYGTHPSWYLGSPISGDKVLNSDTIGDNFIVHLTQTVRPSTFYNPHFTVKFFPNLKSLYLREPIFFRNNGDCIFSGYASAGKARWDIKKV